MDQYEIYPQRTPHSQSYGTIFETILFGKRVDLVMQDPRDQLFEQVESYPWGQDADFQSGLEAILGAGPSPEQTQELTLRARCYYYERKHGCPELNFDSYKAWRTQHKMPAVGDIATNGISSQTPLAAPSNLSDNKPQAVASTSNSASDPAAPYPNSFAQIVDLITKGEPIPGIREIPDTVLSGKKSESRMAKRRKPWEKDGALEIGGSTTITLDMGGPEPKNE
ncbi:hypothetical protein FGG08_005035 [Glutinoglossum americanum]|uniref:Uncharacterized protein n=1 Tax=Glutinoglossum americanum TaxID=1670608 RepID=A0A9P8HZ21_9PEZI|nr:hypothetical protein FGG08_005035 [Glutinoglossum americanum]